MLTMRLSFKDLSVLLAPALLAVDGCSADHSTAALANSTFSVSPGISSIDTNCTGCNAAGAKGASVEQFTTTLTGGGAAKVSWAVSGGDPNTGPGTITSTGQYTPPPYLTADRVPVRVTATLDSNAVATALLTVTPGFLQPLTPENAALGANGQVTVNGYLALAGGYAGINFALSNTATGSTGGQGSLGLTTCQRSTGALRSGE